MIKMKRVVLLCAGLILCNVLLSQTANPDYDSTLTRDYGSDDYGMKGYTLVILKTGTAVIEDRQTVDSLFAGHLNNIKRLAESGELIVAGPLGKNAHNYRGIFILDTSDVDEANEILQTDPAIREKLLEPEVFKWYGSAALPEYLKMQHKLGKFRF
jgi:uncharacterized protein YciI